MHFFEQKEQNFEKNNGTFLSPVFYVALKNALICYFWSSLPKLCNLQKIARILKKLLFFHGAGQLKSDFSGLDVIKIFSFLAFWTQLYVYLKLVYSVFLDFFFWFASPFQIGVSRQSEEGYRIANCKGDFPFNRKG